MQVLCNNSLTTLLFLLVDRSAQLLAFDKGAHLTTLSSFMARGEVGIIRNERNIEKWRTLFRGTRTYGEATSSYLSADVFRIFTFRLWPARKRNEVTI